MDEKLLKFCRYYKGEEKCPKEEPWHPFVRFWNLERDYVCNIYHRPTKMLGKEYDEEHKFWETEGLNMCLENAPEIEKYFESKGYNLEVKGMLACFVILTYTHCPAGGIDFILDYGNK